MKKDSKQRLFEVMQRLDKTFKPRLNENSENDGRVEQIIQMITQNDLDLANNNIDIEQHRKNEKKYSDTIKAIRGGQNIDEERDLRNPKIQRLVDEVNGLIASTVDSDGDPIGVIDTSSTWEEPYVYEPIIYNKMGQLIIKSSSQYDSNKVHKEVINSRDMEFDGIPTLRDIAKQYRKALRSKNTNTDLNEDVNQVSVINQILSDVGGKYYKNPEIGSYGRIDTGSENAWIEISYSDRNNEFICSLIFESERMDDALGRTIKIPMDFNNPETTKEKLKKGFMSLNRDNMLDNLYENTSKEPFKNLKYEKGTNTIRTVPENYWIATVTDNGQIMFDSWDGAIKGRVDKEYVKNWFKNNVKNN